MAKTETDIRHDSKARMKRYRAEMIEKGYTSTTVFLSKEHRAELKRLGDEHRLTRAEAAEHIFNIYLQSDNKNITRTDNTNIGQQAKILASIVSMQARLKALEEKDLNHAEKIEERIPVTDPAITPSEGNLKVPGDMPDRSNKDAYRTWLFSYIETLKDSGLTWVEITHQLNSNGILSIKGKPFSRGAVDVFFKRELKKLAG